MAEKPEVNKSEAIRNYFKKNKKAAAQEVVDALAREGVTVNAGLVYAVKAKHNQRVAARKTAKRPAEAKATVTDEAAEVNKTEAVRDYLKQHRKASSDEVVESLKAQGITVSNSLVRNVKSKSKKRRKAVKQVVAAVAPTGIGVKEIKEALTFIKTVGSEAAAKQALAAAVEIKKIV